MHFIMGLIMPQWVESQRHMVVVKCVYVCECVCDSVIPQILLTTTTCR